MYFDSSLDEPISEVSTYILVQALLFIHLFIFLEDAQLLEHLFLFNVNHDENKG